MGSFDDFSGSQKRRDLKVQPFMFMGCKDLSTDQCAPSGRNDHISPRPFGTFESISFPAIPFGGNMFV